MSHEPTNVLIRVAKARSSLVRIRRGRGGWAYTPEGIPSAEATALACLGLLATEGMQSGGRDGGREATNAAADWLAAAQNPDGSVSVHPGQSGPGWATPQAVVVWSRSGRCKASGDRALRWLLGQKGRTMPRAFGESDSHDTTLSGWSWTQNTHSWVEPTAWAVLAMSCRGLTDHPRVQEALQLLKDRAIKGGGWNYGVKAVLHQSARPQPAPTGLALLALAAAHAAGRSDVADSLSYLKDVLPRARGLHSLCWGLLGLHAWSERLESADRLVQESYLAAPRATESGWHLSQLLLSSVPDAVGAFGLALEAERVRCEPP